MKKNVMSAVCNARTLAVSVCPGCAGQGARSARRVGFYTSAIRFYAYCIFYYFYFYFYFTCSAHQPKRIRATALEVA